MRPAGGTWQAPVESAQRRGATRPTRRLPLTSAAMPWPFGHAPTAPTRSSSRRCVWPRPASGSSPPPTSPRPAGTRSPSRSRSIRPATRLPSGPAPTAPSRRCKAPRGRRPAAPGRRRPRSRLRAGTPSRRNSPSTARAMPSLCGLATTEAISSFRPRTFLRPPVPPLRSQTVARRRPRRLPVAPAAAGHLWSSFLTHVHFTSTRGTSFRLRLSDAAKLGVRIARRATGPAPPRHVRGPDRSSCLGSPCNAARVRSTSAACARPTSRREQSASRSADASATTVLRPGRYTATLTATNAGGRSRAVKLAFVIVR